MGAKWWPHWQGLKPDEYDRGYQNGVRDAMEAVAKRMYQEYQQFYTYAEHKDFPIRPSIDKINRRILGLTAEEKKP